MKHEVTTRLLLHNFGGSDDRVRRTAAAPSSPCGEEDDSHDGDKEGAAGTPERRPPLKCLPHSTSLQGNFSLI